jgi:hypothetical protein
MKRTPSCWIRLSAIAIVVARGVLVGNAKTVFKGDFAPQEGKNP